MNARVRVEPSGREFETVAEDTLLEAALRAGIALNYGCSSGNCGLCKARILSGQVHRVRHQDYVLSEAEKNQGYVLLCATAAAGEVVLEAGIATGPEDIQFQDVIARVKGLRPLTDKVLLLQLQTPRSTRLRFLAGQSVALSLGEESGVYPIASCPCDDRNLEFHLRLEAEDAFTQRLAQGVRPGERVEVYGPVGDFVLHQDSRRPILLLACNNGFAPIKSLMEHAVSLDVAPSLHLYWLATTPGGHYLSNWCRAWADALDAVHYRELTAARLEGVDPARVFAPLVEAHPDLAGFDCYVAGPEAFLAMARSHLMAHAADPARYWNTRA